MKNTDQLGRDYVCCGLGSSIKPIYHSVGFAMADYQEFDHLFLHSSQKVTRPRTGFAPLSVYLRARRIPALKTLINFPDDFARHTDLRMADALN